MSDVLIECVPNFSEGANPNKVASIVSAMQLDGVSLLDWSLDADHNRSVVTIAGPPAAVVEAAIRAAGRAAELIDLTSQAGVHPRIGAADVIPFVPRNTVTRRPMLEQIAVEAVESVTVPLSHIPAGMSPCEYAEMWADRHSGPEST